MRWFTADLHEGHRNIIAFCSRPFRDIDHQTEELVARWNATVAEDDEVIIVGDLSFRRVDATIEFLRRLRGTKHLVRGNHDRRSDCRKLRQSGVLATVQAEMVLEPWLMQGWIVGAPELELARVPVYVRHTPEFTARWPGNALLMINGHVHEKWSARRREHDALPLVNVGVDQWGFRPVCQREIVARAAGARMLPTTLEDIRHSQRGLPSHHRSDA